MNPVPASRVTKVARSWVGTPFYPHCCKKGVGVDCVHLALAVYKEAGVLPDDLELPHYTLDGGEHLHDSLVVQWLARSPLFVVSSEMPCEGELLVIRYARVEHHVGVMTEGTKFVQAVRHGGVVERDMRDSTWSSRLRGCWRPVNLCSEATTTYQ